MTRKTISERVLAYLKEQPGSPLDIARALNLKRRQTRMGYTYYWGHWSFGRAEKEGLIVDKGNKWHLVKRNPFTSVGLDLLFEARRTDDVDFLKQWTRDSVTWYESEKGRMMSLLERVIELAKNNDAPIKLLKIDVEALEKENKILTGNAKTVWVPRGFYSESKVKDDDVQMIILEGGE